MGLTEKFNLLEALLWFITGAFILSACYTHFAPRYHRVVIVTGLLFLLLGCASFAEFVVVAMSAPFWLLAWKTLNVAALLACVSLLFWEHKFKRRPHEHLPEHGQEHGPDRRTDRQPEHRDERHAVHR